jgi:hypothetical protein
MTIELLIHAIVRQTTILIAQLATSGGTRAPLAQVASQVFLDLVRELERQGVSRKVSADMFGLGLRTYQRKIQRFTESSTERGRSLWVAVLDYVQSRGMVTRAEVMLRFAGDDETLVRGVLRDLCDSQLVSAAGTGAGLVYRSTSDHERGLMQKLRASEGLDELLWAIVYREGPLAVPGLAKLTELETSELELSIARLVESKRVERTDEGLLKATNLVIPLGSPVGWEASVFDHFKAMVNTVTCRLREDRAASSLSDRVGGSTYTLEVWPGHPLEHEAFETLQRLRAELSDLRQRINRENRGRPSPESLTRVLVYLGQCVIPHDGASDEEES